VRLAERRFLAAGTTAMVTIIAALVLLELPPIPPLHVSR